VKADYELQSRLSGAGESLVFVEGINNMHKDIVEEVAQERHAQPGN
jgi:hypothetical protein